MEPAVRTGGSYQGVVVEHRWPVWSQLWLVCVLAIGVTVLAKTVFRRLAPAMGDEL